MANKVKKIREKVRENPDRLLFSFTCGDPNRDDPVPLTRVFALLVGAIGKNGEARVVRLAGKVVDQGKWIRFAEYWRCRDKKSNKPTLLLQQPTDGRPFKRAGLSKELVAGSKSMQFRHYHDKDWDLLNAVEKAFETDTIPYQTVTDNPFHVVGRKPYIRFTVSNILERLKEASPIMRQALDTGLSLQESLALAQDEVCLDTAAGPAWPFLLCYTGNRVFTDTAKLDTWYHAPLSRNSGTLDKNFISIAYKC
jgi:hypothetical protein